MSHPDERLNAALKKIREHEETILHQAAVSRQLFYSLRTQHGVICPDCKQEVAHECALLPQSSLITSYGHQPPSQFHQHPGSIFCESVTANPSFAPLELSTSHVQIPTSSSNISSVFTPYPHPPSSATSGNPLGSETLFSDPAAQGNLSVAAYAPSASFESSISHVWLPPPQDSKIFTSNSYSIRLPSPTHFQYGKSPTNPECGPERKRVRPNLPEERSTIQQGEFHPSQPLASPGLCLPSFADSFPPFSTTRPAPETIFSPSVPGTPATSSDVITEPASRADWSITYNTEVKREIEVSVVRPLDVGSRISCLTFSKDGKYLAVGFWNNGTNIYDVQTGDKTCTLREYIYAKNGNEKYMTIDALCFSSDGLHLATGSKGLTRIWEISKKHVRNVLRSSTGKFDHYIQLSSNSRLIASGYTNSGILEIWNWRDSSRKSFEVSEKGINAVRFSPDGQHIAVAQRGPEVLICNVRTGQLIKTLVGNRALFSVAFMPDGTGLIGGGWGKTVKCWDISSLGFRSQRMKAMETGTTKEFSTLSGLEAIEFVAVSSNARWIIFCSDNGVIRISNAHSAELHCELRPRHCVESMGGFDVSPITGFLAACCFDGSRVFLWRFQDVLD